MRWSIIPFIGLILVEQAAAQTKTPAEIYSSMGPAVAQIEYEAKLHDGTLERGTGSAFLVSGDGLLLTCKHVVPDSNNYQSLTMTVRLGRLGASQLTPTVVWLSSSEDLALLQVPVSNAPSVRLAVTDIPIGSDVVVLGFPLNLDLNITRGIISGPGTNGRLVMDSVINAGNSGGPVLGLDGTAAGVAWGAALQWRVGETEVPVEGVKYFIPSSKVLSLLPADARARIDGAPASTNVPLVTTLRRAETVSFMKDDHPVLFASHSRVYRKIFNAEAGYRIVNWRMSETSRNHVPDVSVIIAPDGSTAELKAVIESGPSVDRWRGWLMATVELEQRKLN